ncbi:MAG: DUF4357 domain-containing protein [Bacteroidaceae bacterium]|nr:DUF4357 domain-containing protein [Bacteroidaceae bacterium]
MVETWNKFVWKLIDCKNKNVDEAVYHNMIEDKLELLGWAAYRGEICHKPKIPIGSSGNIQPDILIKRNDDESLFVIEVKRPNHTQRDRELRQLFSYMLQLRLKIGVYIGEHIEVFYDQPDNNADPVSVFKVDLSMNNKNGATFVEYFSCDSFDKEKVGLWCEERLQEMQRRESLNRIREGLMSTEGSRQITRSVRQYLLETYGNEFSESAIDEMLRSLIFKAELKSGNETPQKVLKPKKSIKQELPKGGVEDNSSIPCFLKRGKLNVKGLFHIQTQSLTVLKGNVINSQIVPSFRPIEIKKRLALVEKFISVQKGEYIVNTDVEFSTPSGAAVFCIGGSANGWREWKDSKGETLNRYRKGNSK